MTIEERAHQYGCKAAGGWYKGGIRGLVYEANHYAYLEIATEQRKIDIDKACKWMESSPLSDYLSCEMIEDFKKAMEEL